MRTDNRSDLLRRRVIGKSVIFHENEVTYLNYIQDARENVFPKNPNSEQPDNSWKVVQGHRASIDVDCAQRRWFWWKGVETPFHWARDQEPLRGCDAWAPPKCLVNNQQPTLNQRTVWLSSLEKSSWRVYLSLQRGCNSSPVGLPWGLPHNQVVSWKRQKTSARGVNFR